PPPETANPYNRHRSRVGNFYEYGWGTSASAVIMAQHGYAGATIPRIVAAAGIPLSSIYHYFGSKEGLLYAVMERGGSRMAETIAAAPPDADPLSALTMLIDQLRENIEAYPHFFNLVLTTIDTAAGTKAKPAQLARDLRDLGLTLLRSQIATVLDIDPKSEAAEHMARFARATIDGALLAERGDQVPLQQTLAPLPVALLATHQHYQQSDESGMPSNSDAAARHR
ncbi:TetR/AcrR family transcriptional regulator, partial [Nocardia sp. NPDC052112]|uniref:TetR/AcrR family transcriptional regulator n=1 Tax=Nocardia sp. NPDC052112 TaxID=3155646 RepID=UPI0034271332